MGQLDKCKCNARMSIGLEKNFNEKNDHKNINDFQIQIDRKSRDLETFLDQFIETNMCRIEWR